MSRVVLLDSGPLGMVTNPKLSPLSEECQLWLDSQESRGYTVMLPEIADYEVRRELLRAGKVAGIGRLDELKSRLTYLPISTLVMLLAADFWAEARKRGRPTADPKAQLQTFGRERPTTNSPASTARVRHINMAAQAPKAATLPTPQQLDSGPKPPGRKPASGGYPRDGLISKPFPGQAPFPVC